MEAVPEGLVHKHMGEKRFLIVRNASTLKYILILANIYLSLSLSISLSPSLYIYITQAFHKDDVHMNQRPPNLVDARSVVVDKDLAALSHAKLEALCAEIEPKSECLV